MAVILGKGNNYIGAGALLNANYVLTAAHKVQSWKYVPINKTLNNKAKS